MSAVKKLIGPFGTSGAETAWTPERKSERVSSPMFFVFVGREEPSCPGYSQEGKGERSGYGREQERKDTTRIEHVGDAA